MQNTPLVHNSFQNAATVNAGLLIASVAKIEDFLNAHNISAETRILQRPDTYPIILIVPGESDIEEIGGCLTKNDCAECLYPDINVSQILCVVDKDAEDSEAPHGVVLLAAPLIVNRLIDNLCSQEAEPEQPHQFSL
jgi:hypothetical protein